MASQVFKRGPATPHLNITPLIDVVFLLIVFFMLVSNIVADQNVKMIVPVLADPRTRELGEVDRLVVNLVPEAGDRGNHPLLVDPQPQSVKIGTQTLAPADLDSITAVIRGYREQSPDLEVVLRADVAMSYDAVSPVMAAITAAGVETVHLAAYLPNEGPSTLRETQ